mmetsp:Transcript_72809/g.210799  ORF Transcript_72809/g.210799 Transcript_72809/m.210799 type:complete len:229 (-) Transcript_72809:22-708(-)
MLDKSSHADDPADVPLTSTINDIASQSGSLTKRPTMPASSSGGNMPVITATDDFPPMLMFATAKSSAQCVNAICPRGNGSGSAGALRSGSTDAAAAKLVLPRVMFTKKSPSSISASTRHSSSMPVRLRERPRVVPELLSAVCNDPRRKLRHSPPVRVSLPRPIGNSPPVPAGNGMTTSCIHDRRGPAAMATRCAVSNNNEQNCSALAAFAPTKIIVAVVRCKLLVSAG